MVIRTLVVFFLGWMLSSFYIDHNCETRGQAFFAGSQHICKVTSEPVKK